MIVAFGSEGRIEMEANDPYRSKAGKSGGGPVIFMLTGWASEGFGLARISTGLAEGALYAFTAFLVAYGAIASWFGTKKSFIG